jgi:Flp pilus assembly protein TadG
MKKHKYYRQKSKRRRGATIVKAAILTIVLVGITGMVLDVGFIKVTRTQLQAGSDASSLAAVQELLPGLGAGAYKTQGEVEAAAGVIAVQYAAMHHAGDRTAAYADANRDVRFGNAIYDSASGTWQKSWNTPPINMVGVTLHRDQATSSNGDDPLPLFFGNVFGKDTANVQALAAAAILPGSRLVITPGSGVSCGVIPFAIDLDTWEYIRDGTPFPGEDGITDNYSYDPETGEVIEGVGDGIAEGDLYPHEDETVPNAGNRGTVDLGPENNSTDEIKRQILYGLNDDDLSYFDGVLYADENNPLWVSGETGLSAGFENELQEIIGETRLIPVFDQINEGSGENAEFRLIKFVGVRILDVELGGPPLIKHIFVQPAPVVDPCVEPDLDEEIDEESIFAPPILIE